MDNYTGRYDCIAEHGLSYFIEIPGCNILFDTGASEYTVLNASKLGIDLKKLNYNARVAFITKYPAII